MIEEVVAPVFHKKVKGPKPDGKAAMVALQREGQAGEVVVTKVGGGGKEIIIFFLIESPQVSLITHQ